jgi:hypothetical protein
MVPYARLLFHISENKVWEQADNLIRQPYIGSIEK